MVNLGDMKPKKLIDKLAFVHVVDRKVLMSLSEGKDAFYIPGGKREEGETDEQALVREVKEELDVDIKPETMREYGVFEAQAHGKPEGTIVRMACYEAEFEGELKPSAEIVAIDWYTHDRRDLVGPVDQLILDDLKKRDLID